MMPAFFVPGIGIIFFQHVASCFQIIERASDQNDFILPCSNRPQFKNTVGTIHKTASAVVHTAAFDSGYKHFVIQFMSR